jgi:hypothetical protein
MTNIATEFGVGLLRSQMSSAHLLQEETDKIKSQCLEAHDKKTVVACAECYKKWLQQIRSLFAPSAVETRWFDGRTGFLAEMDALLSKGEEYKVHYNTIDEIFSLEYQRWISETFSQLSGVKELVEEALGKGEFRSRINQRNSNTSDILHNALLVKERKDPATFKEAEVFADALLERETSEGHLDIYKQMLYSKEIPDSPRSRESVQRLENGVHPRELLRELNVGSERSRIAMEKDRKLHRIKELRRGKAADEAQKRKKRGAPEGGSSVPAVEIMPCLECEKVPEPGSSQISCPLCWVEVHLDVREEFTTWCSESCASRGYVSHTLGDSTMLQRTPLTLSCRSTTWTRDIRASLTKTAYDWIGHRIPPLITTSVESALRCSGIGHVTAPRTVQAPTLSIIVMPCTPSSASGERWTLTVMNSSVMA